MFQSIGNGTACPLTYSSLQQTLNRRDIGTNISTLSSYELTIYETNGSLVTFTYGLYSRNHINAVERAVVILENGYGSCSVTDGWGNDIEMDFRFLLGKIYVTVSGPESSTLITRLGEKEFTRMD